MRIIVESWNKKFSPLAPKVKRTALKLGRLLDLKSAHLDICLVGDKFMRKNVLAFPAPKGFPRPDIKGKHLGEIYLNPDYIAKERLEIVPPLAGSRLPKLSSLDGGRNLKLEIPAKLAYMLIHGFLHLLGYDHKKKSDTIIMQKKELLLMRRLRQ